MNSDSTTYSLDQALRAAGQTKALEIGHGLLSNAPRMFREQFGAQPALVVADLKTFAAAGKAVIAAFRSAAHPLCEPFIFKEPDLHAEHRFVTELESALSQQPAMPVAVGSGTINDLTKLAARRTGRPYLCVATAASMDGYTAFGASITHEGAKQTFECPAPRAVLADLSVICAAPDGLNAAGYADLLAKVPAGADWILSDAVGSEPIHAQAWAIIQGRLRELVDDPAGIPARNPDAIERLTEGLMIGGFAMQAAQSSRPASGAEHGFSHLWDMQHHTHNGQVPLHGFKVGIGTLATTALYEELLPRAIEDLDVDRCCAAWPSEEAVLKRIETLFGSGGLAQVALKETRAKYCRADELRAQLVYLRPLWPELRQSLRAQLLPFATLKQMLQAAGAPTEPEQVGISRARLRDSFWLAYFTRRRFNILDVAVRTGLLDDCLSHIFGPNGPWPIQKL